MIALQEWGVKQKSVKKNIVSDLLRRPVSEAHWPAASPATVLGLRLSWIELRLQMWDELLDAATFISMQLTNTLLSRSIHAA